MGGDFDKSVSILQGDGTHRTWSLIITVFGDLAQEEGASISGALLTRLMDLVGVKPEAARVALHRLRRDGWIESQRLGRASMHRLAEYGRAQSAAATPRIYAAAPSDPQEWHLLIAGGGEGSGRVALDLAGGITLGPNAALIAGPPPEVSEGMLIVEAARMQLPDWLRAQQVPEDLLHAAARLQLTLQDVAPILSANPDFTPLQRAALRALIVHSWRRVLLRHADLPLRFFPENWQGEACRALFLSCLKSLPRPDLAQLEADETTAP